METITEIKETHVGFEVTTTEQVIELAIDMGQQCCESTGYFWLNEKPDEFIGADLRGVEVVDEALDATRLKDSEVDFYEGGVMFVNLETDRGVLQFVAYNAHNGYYGHEATVKARGIDHSEVL